MGGHTFFFLTLKKLISDVSVADACITQTTQKEVGEKYSIYLKYIVLIRRFVKLIMIINSLHEVSMKSTSKDRHLTVNDDFKHLSNICLKPPTTSRIRV